MIILVNYFNNKAGVFDNILNITSENQDFVLTDTLHNLIRIPKVNVESLKILRGNF